LTGYKRFDEEFVSSTAASGEEVDQKLAGKVEKSIK